jgi:translation initiation factor 1 (eIF-1/SUI1)
MDGMSEESDSFKNNPLAGLSALRGKLPDQPGANAPEPERAPEEAEERELGAKLVVQRERKKRGGKTVTRVRGLELGVDECAALAKELAKAMGCGTSVEDGEILLQGAQVPRAAAWLRKRGAGQVIEGN